MYKYQDILFALREEYIRNEEILKRLEYFVTIKEPKSKVSFYLDKEDEAELPEVRYEIIRRQGLIRKALNKYCGVDTSISSGKIGITVNSDYIVETNDFEINKKYADFVGEELGLLYDREFTLNAFNTVVENNDEKVNVDRKLSICPDRMTAYRRNNTSFITSIYDGVHDVVRFDNNKARCSYDNMYDLLDLEFPKEGFNPYLQSVIEGSEHLGRTTYIYDNDDDKKTKEFEPITEEKRLVLLRK